MGLFALATQAQQAVSNYWYGDAKPTSTLPIINNHGMHEVRDGVLTSFPKPDPAYADIIETVYRERQARQALTPPCQGRQFPSGFYFGNCIDFSCETSREHSDASSDTLQGNKIISMLMGAVYDSNGNYDESASRVGGVYAFAPFSDWFVNGSVARHGRVRVTQCTYNTTSEQVSITHIPIPGNASSATGPFYLGPDSTAYGGVLHDNYDYDDYVGRNRTQFFAADCARLAEKCYKVPASSFAVVWPTPAVLPSLSSIASSSVSSIVSSPSSQVFTATPSPTPYVDDDGDVFYDASEDNTGGIVGGLVGAAIAGTGATAAAIGAAVYLKKKHHKEATLPPVQMATVKAIEEV